MFSEEKLIPKDLTPDEHGQDIEKKDERIDSTKKFNLAFSASNFNDAEKALNEESFESKEKEKLQRLLFQAYYKEENWAGVVRIINATDDPFSQKGRIKRFEELAGEKFKDFENQIVLKVISSAESKEIVEIKSTSDFRELLKQKNFSRADEWLNEIIKDGVYKNLSSSNGEFEKFINDRKRELKNAKAGK